MNLTEQKLLQAIEEVNDSSESYANCQKLATFYTLKHYLYPDDETALINSQPGLIGEYGDSEFYQRIAGQPIEKVIPVMNELMDALKALNPKLYQNTMSRL